MEVLSLLEKKIACLLELISKLKLENTELKTENARLNKESSQLSQELASLRAKVDEIEGSVLSSSKSLDELSQEKELTKIVVDDLIKNIDSFVEKENQ